MAINWSDFPMWLLASFLGALVVKILDLVVSRVTRKQELSRDKAQTILAHLGEYGELTELYRFLAYISESLITGEDGQFIKDDDGRFKIERKILEPEPRFEEAIRALKGTDVNAAISQKIASIRLSSSDAFDSAIELDASDTLRGLLKDVYVKTVIGRAGPPTQG